ncbi:unnamed protein product [Lasius platythorax]|uniref:Uncharacterized protein n=1 Tax=Lasius platythorax TaxID=488582 RepID=A0AAV2NJS0_9HYME
MECARLLGHSDGWLCLRDLTSRSESRTAALVQYRSYILRRQDDDPASGLICPNRIPSAVTVREIEIKETSVVCH